MDLNEDRRETKRYPVQCGAFVCYKKKPPLPFTKTKYVQLGPVSDISAKGISVQYIDSETKMVSSSLLDPEIAISTSSGEIIIENVKYHQIYDSEIATMTDGKSIRRKAIKFIDLSGYQSAWLACLIHNLKSRQIELPYKTDPEDKPVILKSIY